MMYTKLLVFLLVLLWSTGVYAQITDHPIGTRSSVIQAAEGYPDVKTSYWVFHRSTALDANTRHFVNIQVWRYIDVSGAPIDVVFIFAQGILVQISKQ